MIKIKIDSVSQDKVEFGTKITLVSGKNKYAFFNTKKDGSQTKAYEQFKKFGFGIGDEVKAEVKEEEKSFTNKEGKDITYTQRTILYFEEFDGVPTLEVANVPPRVEKPVASVLGGKESVLEEKLDLILAKLEEIQEQGEKWESVKLPKESKF